MSDFTLEPAEMAFMMTLVNAKSIPGVNVAHLFPADPAERNAFLERGGIALAEHGHFKLTNRQFHDMNPLLPEAIAVLATPQQIIHTTAYVGGGTAQAAHYIAQQRVVEFYIMPEGNYRVVLLNSVETAANTVVHNLGVQQAATESAWTLVIPAEQVAQSNDLRAAVSAALANSPVSPQDGTRVITALSNLERYAEIDVAQIVNGEIYILHSILLFRVENEIGMVHTVREGATTLTVPANAKLETTLLESVHSLQAMRQAVL